MGWCRRRSWMTQSTLPYTENLVNEVAVHALGQMPLAEVFRVLVPRGFVTRFTAGGRERAAVEGGWV